MTPLESFPKIHSNLGGYASLLKLSRDAQLTQTWVGGDASALRLIGDSVVRGLSSSPPAMDWEVRLCLWTPAECGACLQKESDILQQFQLQMIQTNQI